MKKIIFYLVLASGLVFADTPPAPPPIFHNPLIQNGRDITCNVASGSQSGCLSASDWNHFNSATGSPGGSNGSVQYNNSGVFAGFGSWNGTLLSIPGNFGVSGTSSLDNGAITTNGSGQLTIGKLITSTGAAFTGNMGFYGTTPIAKPTGDVLLALANLGLLNAPVLLSNDIPNNAANTTGTSTNITASTNATLTTLSSLSLPATQLTGQVSIAHGGTGQATASNAINALLPSQAGNTNLFLQTDGTNVSWEPASGGTGSVTSVALSLPSIFNVSGSPVTTTGTLTGTLATQSANTVFSGPSSGSAAAPTFRSLVTADIPSLSYISSVSGSAPIVSSGGLTPSISITQSTTSTNGYLSSTDWNTFNGKQAALTFNSPLSNSANTISISQATTSTNGYLTSTDWNTFNNKGSGTVTSVALSSPASIISTSGSPVTTSGTLTQTLVTQSANTLWAGPTTGSAAAPTFRAIVPADVPTLNQNTTGTASNITSTSNATLVTLSSLSLPGSQVTGNISGNSANVTGTVAIANGGTGQVTATAAITSLLPSQTGQNGNVLTSNGTVASWVTPAASGVSSVTATAPIVSSGGANPNITCNVSSGSQPGCLSSSDWTSFNSKQSALTFTAPLVNTAGTISIPLATGSTDGYLSAADWTTFNAGSGANKNLSNLNSPTAVNQDLLPNAPNTFQIGNPTTYWTSIYTETLNDTGSFESVAPFSRHLTANDGATTSIDWSNPLTVQMNTELTLPVGTTTLAPLNIPPGTLLTSPVSGSIENDGTNLYYTDSTPTRKVLGAPILTAGSVAFSDGTTLIQDNTNFYWDNTGKTLALGGVFGPDGTVPYAQTSQRTVTNPAGIDGAVFGIHYSNNTTNNSSLNTSGYFEGRIQIDAGVSTAANAGVIFQAYRNNGASDAGALGFLVGAFGGAHQTGTDVAATTDILAGVLSQVDIQNGTANKAADFYGLAGTNGGTLTTGQFGVYIEPPGSGMKDNWLSGQAEIGGSSYASHGNTLKVNGDMSADISVTDTGAVAGIFNSTSNTTVSASNTTLGLNGAATGLVQSGAENDKVVGALNFVTTRGDGTDDGILDAMTGINVLNFHNSGGAGVTQKVYNVSALLFTEHGTVTDLYDYYSMRVPAGDGVVTNHYGVYIENDSTTPVKNWLSGQTQIGGSSFSLATDASMDLQATNKALLINRVDTTTRDGLTAINGMMIYNTTTDTLQCYAGGAWGSCAVGGSGTSAGPSGSVQFSDGSGGFVADGTNFFWDDTSKFLGIGTNAPAGLLQLVSSSTFGTSMFITNTDTGAKDWRIISSGSGNTGGAGIFGIVNNTDDPTNYKVTILPSGEVDIGDDITIIPAGAGPNAVIATANSAVANTKNLIISTGDAVGFNGGTLQIDGGASDTQAGGQISIFGGGTTDATSASASGGPVSIAGGNITSVNANGGDVTILGGVNNSTAANSGGVYITDGNNLSSVAVNTNGIVVLDNTGLEVITTPNTFSTPGTVSIWGQLYMTTSSSPGTQPVVSACGTGPTLSGGASDGAGSIAIGTGVVTSCTLTFSNTWSATPHCFVNDQTTTLATRATPTTTTVIFRGSFVTGDVLDYWCIGEG